MFFLNKFVRLGGVYQFQVRMDRKEPEMVNTRALRKDIVPRDGRTGKGRGGHYFRFA